MRCTAAPAQWLLVIGSRLWLNGDELMNEATPGRDRRRQRAAAPEGIVDITAALRVVRGNRLRHSSIEGEAVGAARQPSESMRYLESVRSQLHPFHSKLHIRRRGIFSCNYAVSEN